jgi:hypothetical protein
MDSGDGDLRAPDVKDSAHVCADGWKFLEHCCAHAEGQASTFCVLKTQ